jgi:hypothetical protein
MKVDSLASYRFKCYMDAYKGYHQICLAQVDEDKTTLHTDIVVSYTQMWFSLKNPSATYQRMMDNEFAEQIGKNLEV